MAAASETDDQTLGESVKHWAETEPDKEAFIFVNQNGRQSTWTSKNVYIAAGRFASRLSRRGLGIGDVIGNTIPNSAERLITDVGGLMAGCTVMNCQITEKDGSDFWNNAQLTKCKSVIVAAHQDNSAYSLFTRTATKFAKDTEITSCFNVSFEQSTELNSLFLVNRSTTSVNKDQEEKSSETEIEHEPFLDGLLSSDEPIYINGNSSLDDLAYIFTTSGSTGYCKLVPRFAYEIFRIGRAHQKSPLIIFSDRIMGWYGGFPFQYFAFGDGRVMQDNFEGNQIDDVLEVWKMAELEKCQLIALMPSEIADLAKRLESDPSTYKPAIIATGGQPMKKVHFGAAGKLSYAFVSGYGSTEMGIICMAFLTSADMVSKTKDFMCGPPLGKSQVKIVDGNMKEVAQGTEGNVVVKSECMFSGYFKDTSNSAKYTDDGFFLTGDRGLVDESGNLFVFGREGEVSTKNTFLIYHSWPERILIKCPDVLDVKIISTKRDDEEDRLCACVELRKDSEMTEDKIMQFYKEQLTDSTSVEHFLPHLDGVIIYSAFPTGLTGKLDKKRMQQDFMQRMKS